MSESSFGYFHTWDLDGGDTAQWQQLFDDQALEADRETTHGVDYNGTIEHQPPYESTAASPLEAETAHNFDERLLDSALFLDSSNVPWPTIEQHEPLVEDARLVGDSAVPTEQAAHQSSSTVQVSRGSRRGQQREYADTSNPRLVVPGSSIDDRMAWPASQATHYVPTPAPIANMQASPQRTEAYGFSSRDNDWDQSRSIVDISELDRDLYNFSHDAYDFYKSDHAQPGSDTMAFLHNISGQGSAQNQYAEPQTRAQPYLHGHQLNDVSFTQVPKHNIHLAYREQSFSPRESPAGLDASFSPDAAYSPDIFSPTPGLSEFSPEPEGQARRARSKASRNPNVIVMKHSVTCVGPGCGKAFKNRTHVLDLCNRCAKKHDRRTVEAQPIELDPSVPDISTARNLIFATQPGRGPPIPPDELQDILAQEDRYVQRLIDAVNEIVPGGEGGDLKKKGLSWEARQQITLNQTLYMEGPRKGEDGLYRSPLITARLRALFREMYQFHTGIAASQDCFYPVGGANAGYNPDTNLDFHERFEKIHELFQNNKRMVMDVIEGRGVKCIVSNPVGYNKRKVANNACNEDKKEIMDVGKEKIELEGSAPPRKKRRRGRLVADDTPEFQLPESSRVQTRRGAGLGKAGQRPGDSLDHRLREALDAGGYNAGPAEVHGGMAEQGSHEPGFSIVSEHPC